MSTDIINNVAALPEIGVDENIKMLISSNEEEQMNAIRIINNINNEMQPEIVANPVNVSAALSVQPVSTQKVSLPNSSRVRIISSSDILGKNLFRNVNMPKIINVSLPGAGNRKDFIKLVSGNVIRSVRSIPLTTGASSPKIIRIKSENDVSQNISIASLNNSPNLKKIVTIQATSSINNSPIHLTNSVKLSPTNLNFMNKTIQSNQLSTPMKGSTANIILLTPKTSCDNKTFQRTPGMVRPSPSCDVKSGICDRYERGDLNNSANLRMNANRETNHSSWQQYVRQYAHMGPCPICEDSISGYHYGIFCCESCKGFFKRSVQNHKDYVCHIQISGGEPCGINKHTRKKCPSCRFKRCVDKGMRIEAVRNDRSRGGRSLYPGSRNRIHRYQLHDSPSEESQRSPITPSNLLDQSRYLHNFQQLHPAGNSLLSVAHPLRQSSNISSCELSQNLGVSSNGPLHRALSSRGRTSMMSVLDNIVVIEEQLQQEKDVLGPIVEDDDMAVYRVLLKLAEQRLHRMVRWSRALPEFSAIDTDDQIMLVQNCWAELLILDCCYRSLGDPREIHLTSGKCINLEAACELGAEDIVRFILRTTQKLKQLKLDMREYACLKVLLLMQPDLKQLKAEGRVRMFQETISQLLLDHTNENHESDLPNKFYDLIVVVPEIREASSTVRSMLTGKDLGPFLSSNSLLLELLNCNVSLSTPITAAQLHADIPHNAASTPVETVSVTAQVGQRDVKIVTVLNMGHNHSTKCDLRRDPVTTTNCRIVVSNHTPGTAL